MLDGGVRIRGTANIPDSPNDGIIVSINGVKEPVDPLV